MNGTGGRKHKVFMAYLIRIESPRDLSGLVSAVLSILHHYLDISEQVKRTNFKFIDTIKDDIS